jgi:hypothetical protein
MMIVSFVPVLFNEKKEKKIDSRKINGHTMLAKLKITQTHEPG